MLNAKRILKCNSMIQSLNRSFRYASVLHNNPTSSEAFITSPDKLKSKYDVVIIGAGHNGLIAANYLAKMSKNKLKICLLERRHVVGGAAVTEEIVPGFKFSRASYLLSLFRPIIIQELDLMRHGTLKFHTRDPSGYTPLIETDPQYSSSCRSLTLGPHANKNYEQIAKFSKKDAHKFEKYENWLNEICSVLERFLDNPPPNLSIFKEKGRYLQKLMLLRNYLSDISAVNFFAKHHDEIYRLFTAPAAHILNEWFESDVLKATIATDSVIGAMLSPYSEGSAYVLLHHIIGGIDGQKGVWAYVQGGMGSISKCLAENAKSFGDQIDIFVSQEVSEIKLKKQDKGEAMKVEGVLLANGKFIEADCVLSNATPHVTFNKLLQTYNLENSKDQDTGEFMRRVKNIQYESGVTKINLAVSKLPNFKADPTVDENVPMPHHRCTIHFNCENMGLIDEAFKDAKYHGIPSRKPMIEMVIPSSLDPTLAPKGAHVILLFCQYFPNHIKDAKAKEDFSNAIFDCIEQYAPGFKSSIIGKDVLVPNDLENIFGLTGGNIFHGAMSLNQLFINRPVSGQYSYNTPIEGLYLAGSGAHPGGGVMGSPGRLAALECIKSFNK